MNTKRKLLLPRRGALEAAVKIHHLRHLHYGRPGGLTRTGQKNLDEEVAALSDEELIMDALTLLLFWIENR